MTGVVSPPACLGAARDELACRSTCRTVTLRPRWAAPMDEPERRAFDRLPGPFEARRDEGTRVVLYNLSEGGCFVNAADEPTLGQRTQLRIELTNEGSVAVSAEVVHAQRGFGYGVRFVGMSDSDRLRLRQILSAL